MFAVEKRYIKKEVKIVSCKILVIQLVYFLFKSIVNHLCVMEY